MALASADVHTVLRNIPRTAPHPEHSTYSTPCILYTLPVHLGGTHVSVEEVGSESVVQEAVDLVLVVAALSPSTVPQTTQTL